MQIPDDLTNTEKELCEIIFTLIGAAFADQIIFGNGVNMGAALIVTGPKLANIIGNQPVDVEEIIKFASDQLSLS